MTSKDSNLREAMDMACRYLSVRSHSAFEIREKLKKKQVRQEDIDGVISRLKELKYLDDRAFARIMAEELARIRLCGPYYIKNKLRLKGLDEVIIEETLEGIFSGNPAAAAAEELAEKRLKGKKITTDKEWERLGRYLQSRGHSWETIRETLRKYDDRKRD